jgi:hypothetical protein
MVFINNSFKDRFVGHGCEEEHAGTYFYGVLSKDFVDSLVAVEYGLRCFYKSLSKDWKFNVCIGFFSSVDSVEM